jgi:hypothetical protein
MRTVLKEGKALDLGQEMRKSTRTKLEMSSIVSCAFNRDMLFLLVKCLDSDPTPRLSLVQIATVLETLMIKAFALDRDVERAAVDR